MYIDITTNDKCRTARPRAQTHNIHILSRDGDEDNEVKRTCYASNIDATTSQATSNLDAHEPHCHTQTTSCASAPGFHLQ
jgi:hypothetical protein